MVNCSICNCSYHFEWVWVGVCVFSFGESRVPFPCQSSFDKFFPSNCYCFFFFLSSVRCFFFIIILVFFFFLLIFFSDYSTRQICCMLLDLNWCLPPPILPHAHTPGDSCSASFISVSSFFSADEVCYRLVCFSSLDIGNVICTGCTIDVNCANRQRRGRRNWRNGCGR